MKAFGETGVLLGVAAIVLGYPDIGLTLLLAGSAVTGYQAYTAEAPA